MAKETKELEVKKPAGVLATTDYVESDFLDDSVDMQDLLISKMLLMQGTSQAVSDEKAFAGDIIDSVTGEKMGSGREKDFTAIGIVPLMSTKSWVVYEMIDGQPDWKEEVAMTPANINWQKEEEIDGITYRRDRSLNFYVLREDQLDDPTAIPYMISFRRTAYRVGQALSTHFIRCNKANAMIKARRAAGQDVPYVKPCGTVFNLCAKKTSNDTNTWWVPTIEKKGALDDQHLSTCAAWLKTLKSGSHKVDQSEYSGETESVTEYTENVARDDF